MDRQCKFSSAHLGSFERNEVQLMEQGAGIMLWIKSHYIFLVWRSQSLWVKSAFQHGDLLYREYGNVLHGIVNSCPHGKKIVLTSAKVGYTSVACPGIKKSFLFLRCRSAHFQIDCASF